MAGSIVVVCNTSDALDNRRGTIVGWSEERSEWTVAVYDGPTIQLGKRQLHTIGEGWHTDMKSRLFDKVGIMRHFQGPGSHKPPRHAEFRQRSVVPTTKMIEDVWGKRIWSYMEAYKPQGPIGGGLRCAADMYPYYFEEFLLYYGPYEAVPLWHQSGAFRQTYL